MLAANVGAKLLQDALLENVLVAQKDLGQQWLQARVDADHGDESEATTQLSSSHVLHNLCPPHTAESSLSADGQPLLLITMQPARGLVQVDAQYWFFPCLVLGEIPKLPRRVRLQELESITV